ncbi:uncharacterized protein PFL1_01753 [Pseudozyma flocculosa PF-1]|uniref:Fe2OG dioxygenase domain-containing protein n=1 Tax=Pseudozyma flocculosa TaxID=84751 RepID=A0A5C3EXG6_9BASI|nr:uncharacterized protein PFL1_01753 [Pseudozyma flocculosa PF-1]EPQ30856.1 hypothetical protein PFL1_01753 [Pseudozyma flocculosa PF-1]SPO36772.1 uncharacterized protein PSFLO_02243 [Pseudozyma flocculosa]
MKRRLSDANDIPSPSTSRPRHHDRPDNAGDDDKQLQLALDLSRRDAQLERMSEQDQIQEAIRQSMLHQEAAAPPPIPAAPNTTSPRPPKAATPLSPEAKLQPIAASRPIASSTKIAPLFASPAKAKPRLGDHGDDGDSRSSAATADAIDWDHTLLFSQEPGRTINRLDGSLDLEYWPGWLLSHPDPDRGRKVLMRWMLNSIQWHRVTYTRPGGFTVRTPRYTTTFGRDETGAPDSAYDKPPKPFPAPLLKIKLQVERLTGASFNSVIVNFYADGNDSISYHSDDEAFLGPNPTIASLTLGSSRDFYMRRKAPAGVDVAPPTKPSGSKGSGPAATRPTEKMVLNDGDLLVMRGKTQAEWEHSVPKRAGNVGGRINLTFRRCVSKRGTDNFLRYNRGGVGDTWRWNGTKMVPGKGGV